MSKYSSHAICVSSGCDIVKCLRHFTTTQKFQAAFVVRCIGHVSSATLRMAFFSQPYESVKEISENAKIESLVGTISGGYGHLHVSLSNKDGHVTGGHVFGPLVASGNVEIVIGECKDLLFARTHDDRTGFPELVVLSRNSESHLASLSDEATSEGEMDLVISCQRQDDTTIKASHALRMVPGEEICNGLNSFKLKHKLEEPFILTCVGSVTKATIQLCDDKAKELTMEGHYEIVSLVGTSNNLQVSLSDKDGHVTTGHVAGELIVFTTAELVLGEKY